MSHGPHADANDPFQKRTAVAIAAFTTLLAFGNMLTNQARTEAILSSNRATNRWSYYQSKSSKQQITRLELSLLNHQPAGAPEPDAQRWNADVERYEKEKTESRKEAEGFTAVEKAAEHREHFYEYGATVTELAIIVASVALLLTSRKALFVSIVIAALGVATFGYTKFALHAPAQPHEEPPPHAG